VDECIAEFLDDDGHKSSKLEDLVLCCEMDDQCERTLENADECVGVCFDECLQTTPEAYLDCIGDEDKCSIAECSTELEDVDQPVSGDDADDIAKQANKLEPEDYENCDAVDEYYANVCEAGSDCCKDCNPELAQVVDCMINFVVIPVIANELNTTIDPCPVDEDCKYRRRRGLNDAEFLGLPQKDDLPQSKRNSIKDAMRRALAESKTVEECDADFENNMLVTDVSDAASIYVECLLGVSTVTVAATEAPAETSGSPAFQMATLVATLLASLVISF
jgi:hypothetical protein